jgi:hypothetical protein
MPEAHPLRFDDPVDHRAAGLACAQAVPQVLRRRHHQRWRLVIVEGAAADQVRAVLLEGHAARLGQALHRDFGLETLNHLIRDACHRLSFKNLSRSQMRFLLLEDRDAVLYDSRTL